VVALEVRVFGRVAALPVAALARLSLCLAAGGFALAAATGLLMFATQPAELLVNRSFLWKMGLLAAAPAAMPRGSIVAVHWRNSMRQRGYRC
jgi:hypothetical protein